MEIFWNKNFHYEKNTATIFSFYILYKLEEIKEWFTYCQYH